MGGGRKARGHRYRLLVIQSTLLRTHQMPDTVLGGEFRGEDTIHSSCPSEARREKVRNWTKAIEMAMGKRGRSRERFRGMEQEILGL